MGTVHDHNIRRGYAGVYAGWEAVANTMRPLLVQVVNDRTRPVAVTGTTSISGTAHVNVVRLPAVQVQQNGFWNVGITGTKKPTSFETTRESPA